MSDRYQIMDDGVFWSNLECAVTAWLHSSDDPAIRKYWIDGFSPELIDNTRMGVDIEGIIWLMSHTAHQDYRYRVSVPQRMIHKSDVDISVERVEVDEDQKLVEIVLSRAKNVAEQAAASDR